MTLLTLPAIALLHTLSVSPYPGITRGSRLPRAAPALVPVKPRLELAQELFLVCSNTPLLAAQQLRHGNARQKCGVKRRAHLR
jgi:hypothetical protein